jgi:hypothetical protein
MYIIVIPIERLQRQGKTLKELRIFRIVTIDSTIIQVRCLVCLLYSSCARKTSSQTWRPRGGSVTKFKKTPCPPCLGEVLRRELIVQRIDFFDLGVNLYFRT